MKLCKILILFFLTQLFIPKTYCQVEFDVSGYHKRDKKYVEIGDILGEYEDKFYVSELSSVKKTFVLGQRVLQLKTLDKNSLEPIETKQFDQISRNKEVEGFKILKPKEINETSYEYLKSFMLGNIVGIVVLHNETAEVRLIRIDATTLEQISEEVLSSLTDFYHIPAHTIKDRLNDVYDPEVILNVETSGSDNGKFLNLSVVQSGSSVPANIKSWLFDDKFQNVHSTEFGLKNLNYLFDDNLDVHVSNGGETSFLSYSGFLDLADSNFKSSKCRILTVSKNGLNKVGTRIIGIGPYLNGFSGQLTKSLMKNNVLYIAGYDFKRTGYIFSRIDLTNQSDSHVVKFIKFSDSLQAYWYSYKENKFDNGLLNVKNGKKYVRLSLNANNLTIMPDGRLILIGSVLSESMGFDDKGRPQPDIDHGNIQVTCFGPTGRVMSEKVVHSSVESHNKDNTSLYVQTAFSYENQIVLFILNHYSRVHGLNLVAEKNSYGNGTIVCINPSDGSWGKYYLGLTGSLKYLIPDIDKIYCIDDDELLVPCKRPIDYSTGYIKIKFK